MALLGALGPWKFRVLPLAAVLTRSLLTGMQLAEIGLKDI